MNNCFLRKHEGVEPFVFLSFRYLYFIDNNLILNEVLAFV